MPRYYYLTPVLGGPGAPRYPISSESQLIGRSESADIALVEPTVSREHALILLTSNGVHLRDLQSKHGTYVNSKRTDEKVLKVGDIIVFGLSLVLRLEESSQPVTAPPPPSGQDAPTRGVRSTDPAQANPGADGLDQAHAQAEIDLARETVVRLHKLASVGALAADRLPDLHRRLYELAQRLHRQDIGHDDAARSLEAVIQTLAEFVSHAGVGHPHLDTADLFDLARRATAAALPQANEQGVELLLGVPGELRVLTDPARLENAILLLLRFAASASPPKGTVEIRGHGDVDNATLEIAGYYSIPRETSERLFDPFLTLKQDWQITGVGVFEARHLLNAIGATLEFHNPTTAETVMRITLPRP